MFVPKQFSIVRNRQNHAATSGNDLTKVCPARADLARRFPGPLAGLPANLLIKQECAVRLNCINLSLAVGKNFLEVTPARSDDLWPNPSLEAATIGVAPLPVPQQASISLECIDDSLAARKDLRKSPAAANFDCWFPIAGTVVET